MSLRRLPLTVPHFLFTQSSLVIAETGAVLGLCVGGREGRGVGGRERGREMDWRWEGG